MKILITGKGGKTGSWHVRGEQLGRAIGATIAPKHTDFRGADLAIVVKRVQPETLDALRKRGTPWVYDIVDAWPQPQGNAWRLEQAVAWLHGEIERLRPNAVVFSTSTMLMDSRFAGPALVLPHHAWPKYERTAPRETVGVVAYEGAEAYLGAWRPALDAECERRGWRFVVNGDMQAADIGVALRHDKGYPARRWKSNCKLANLQALGIPAVCTIESAYLEFGSEAETLVDDPAELAGAFDLISDFAAREELGALMHAATPRLEVVAEEYGRWIRQLNF